MHILIDLLFYLTSLYRNREIPHQSELIFAYVIVIELDDACSKQYMKKPHVVHSHTKLGADFMALRDLLACLYVALTCIVIFRNNPIYRLRNKPESLTCRSPVFVPKLTCKTVR